MERLSTHNKAFLILAIVVAVLVMAASTSMAQGAGTTTEPRDVVWIPLICAIIALLFCVYLALTILRKDEGTDRMKEIAAAVREGANAYIKRQYMVIAIFFAVVFVILGILALKRYLEPPTPFAFLTGGFF